MADYIDRQAALDVIDDLFQATVRGDITNARCVTTLADGRIEDIPAADVVEVVRCKDCEHCSLLFDKRPLCLAGRAWMPITENDFCVWGKKRADNG